jgi:hypothetical protein
MLTKRAERIRMQPLLLAAGLLAIAVGLAHSVLGEVLIFRSLRSAGIVPTVGTPLLHERHVRILWASWHIVTILGWAMAAIVLRLAFITDYTTTQTLVVNAIITSMLCSSLLVLIATKGMHLGWIGLLGVAVLTWLGYVFLQYQM